MADALELYPSPAEDSEPDDVDPHIPGIAPLQIGDNVWRTDPTLDLQDPRFGLMVAKFLDANAIASICTRC